MKWYNFETMFRSLKDALREYLKTIGIKYELSGCGKGWHFEILLSPSEVTEVNKWLDMHTITEQR